ncbi:MAG TPA: ribosome biogenesis GTPase YlqF [Patescibacteria group bacterium]|nr:ribosome biogenesis GTPase YlqF [Patescibacteria group bacterium]
MHINWFPGHMAKAQRMIREQLKLVDVVLELLDARIPASSSNPVITELIGSKPKVIVLNKVDLAEPEMTERWMKHFRSQGIPVVSIDSVSGKGTKTLVSQIEQMIGPKIAHLQAKGIKQRAIRAMILGIPNVGKSSLINRLLGAATVRTADKPGVTRGQQWLKVGKNLELLDTPGVLWPRLEDQQAAVRLALTGAINDDVYDREKIVLRLLTILRDRYSDRIITRYNLDPRIGEKENNEILAAIAARRGCLRGGGVPDLEKAVMILLGEFRSGKLGVFTLESPDEAEMADHHDDGEE